MSLSLMIDVAGAALFALVGLGVLVLSRGRRRGILVGAAATTFGMTWVFQNFVLAGGPARTAELGLLVSSSFATVAFVALAHHLVRGLRPLNRRWVLALGVVLGLLWATMAALPARRSGGLDHVAAAYDAFLLALVLLVGAIAAAFREARPASRALACLGLAFGPFVAFLAAGFAGSAGFSWRFGTGVDFAFLAMGLAVAAVVVPFARNQGEDALLPRAVFPTLIVAGFAGLLLVILPGDYDGYGAFGIIRTVGAFFLALAALRFGLLEVELPRLATQRGTLATAALASLFIVAQIAQEFFAAEYGLLMGGVVAGTLLFAANPVQRAMERVAERAVPAGERFAVGDSTFAPRAQEAYKRALRVALRDRNLTPDEELEMARLAEDLGIGAGTALLLRRQVEAETGVGGAPA